MPKSHEVAAVVVTPTAERVFTIPEAAEYLRVSRATMYRLIQAGKIATRKPSPGLSRVMGAELLRYMGGA